MTSLLRRFLQLPSVPTLIPTADVQNITYTGTAGAATAIAANEAPGRTCTIRLCALTDCYYLITKAGTTVTTTTGSLLPAGIVEYVRIPNLSIVSVVKVSSDGILNITPMADVSTP